MEALDAALRRMLASCPTTQDLRAFLEDLAVRGSQRVHKGGQPATRH